ncbi:MAG: hypothetical protein A2Y12_04690 [Planctomycetes bacterium GWF2_42_9]|nr:MAG: hypothetical protein A2Y12_04690 [Planctomycetes bacterium GWF2_42_9]
MIAQNQNRYSILYGKETIEFELEFYERQRFRIDVHPNNRVVVYAPIGKNIDEIKERVKKKAPWIIKQKLYFEQYQPSLPNKSYISGETHLYLGRQYRLKVSESNYEEVRLVGKYILVHIKSKQNTLKVKALVEEWYKVHARKIFQQYLLDCYNRSDKFRFELPKYQIRKMNKRWGSYTKRGDILLNLELIKTPLYCIEYVIMHELCHVEVRNHNVQFYKLLTALMPDWKKRKEKLHTFLL